MHAPPPAWRDRLALPHVALFRSVVVGLVIAALVVAWPGSLPANAGDPRIERAQEQRRGAQERLDGVLQRLSELQAGVASAETELERLTATVDAHRKDADHATTAVALLAQASYRYGSADPTLALLSSGSPGEALAQARLLGLIAKQSRAGFEAASAVTWVRTRAADAAKAAALLRVRRDELDQAREEAAGLVAAAEREEQQARAVVEAERAAAEARRAAADAERAAAARTTTAPRAAAQSRPARGASPSAPSNAAAGPSAPISGGIACPVGQPRSYSDTYGAARSGGRAHKGTDILAPRGTPIYAYESGTISRMNSNRLGGISLYLNGASGTRYYYTHLQGYVGGLSAGQSVSSGQQIALNGDTGNARGIPHLHFEVMPGGGGNVNPYPYVRRACG